MPDESEGLRIARGRIAREKKRGSGFLDLGRLGVQSWPEELWELEHLTELNLGDCWYEHGDWWKAESDFAVNLAPPEEMRWDSFPNLKRLHIRSMEWADLSHFSGLASLQFLDCALNGLNTLRGLEGCASLQELYCHNNWPAVRGRARIHGTLSSIRAA